MVDQKGDKDMNKWGVAVKALRAIESCETMEQLDAACNYWMLAAKSIYKRIRHSCGDRGALYHNYDWDALYEVLDIIDTKRESLTKKGGNE